MGLSEVIQKNRKGKPPEHTGENHLSWIDLMNSKSNDSCEGCIWIYNDYHKWARNWWE